MGPATVVVVGDDDDDEEEDEDGRPRQMRRRSNSVPIPQIEVTVCGAGGNGNGGGDGGEGKSGEEEDDDPDALGSASASAFHARATSLGGGKRRKKSLITTGMAEVAKFKHFRSFVESKIMSKSDKSLAGEDPDGAPSASATSPSSTLFQDPHPVPPPASPRLSSSGLSSARDYFKRRSSRTSFSDVDGASSSATSRMAGTLSAGASSQPTAASSCARVRKRGAYCREQLLCRIGGAAESEWTRESRERLTLKVCPQKSGKVWWGQQTVANSNCLPSTTLLSPSPPPLFFGGGEEEG